MFEGPKVTESLDNIARAIRPTKMERFAAGYYQLLEENPGNLDAALRPLVGGYKKLALVDWFRDRDIEACKQHAFVAAKLLRMVCQVHPAEQSGANAHNLLYALLSDNNDMIHWECQYMVPLFQPGTATYWCENPSKNEYHGLQARLALQGEWDILRERCERFLAAPPNGRKLERFDHEFYLGLIDGDQPKMQAALDDLAQPKVLGHRNSPDAFGLESRIVSGWHVIYGKIAHRYGYQVCIDSPGVPNELLPIEPPDEYPEPYDFMTAFDLFTSFDENTRGSVPCIRELSPRPPGEPPLTYTEAKKKVDSALHS
ncbi:hypothetical protein QQM79_20735 [Marinobacteraceae bacterium S3BR75-40.1]